MNPRYCLLAACMAHVEGYYSTKSAAYLHHNPGNIMEWVDDGKGGKKPQIKLYPTAAAGFSALVKDIAANAGMTLRAFIHKYAPPVENDTSMYLQVVSALSGIGQDEVL